ncbi:MAG: hypothetical protein GY816_18195 [Cytophagales bacterium]|nr:hypothetical protein [Cytophagales bacterium]
MDREKVRSAKEKCKIYLGKVWQLKHAAYGAEIIKEKIQQVREKICETPEVQSVHSILCLVIEGLCSIINDIKADFDFH